MQHVDSRLRLGQFVHEVTRTVRRVVIDDEHLEKRILTKNSRQDLGNVFALVVRRNDNKTSFTDRQ